MLLFYYILLKLTITPSCKPRLLKNVQLQFSAHVNLAAYHTISCFLIVLFIGFLLRILLGPFSYAGVVAYHYSRRLWTMSIINMLTFKTGLNVLFIWDFNRMANISEKKVMTWMFLTTSISTLANLLEEALTRDNRGLNHFSRQCFNTYLGKVVQYTLGWPRFKKCPKINMLAALYGSYTKLECENTFRFVSSFKSNLLKHHEV